MAFTEEEKRRWHEARRRGESGEGALDDDWYDSEVDVFDEDDDGENPSVGSICDHCGARVSWGSGNGSPDFLLCDACDGD